MPQYDTTLKLLFQRSAPAVLQEVAGVAVLRWLNVELPRTENRRVDLLGETPEGQLVQFELQTANDPKMPIRMAEYYLAIYRKLAKFAGQIVIYAGAEPMRMKAELKTEAMSHRFQLVDFRTLDGDRLLKSTALDDNMLAILGRVADARGAVRTILDRLASQIPASERARAIQELLVIANLRKLGKVVEEEARKMPSLEEILENEVLGREYKKGLQEGRQEGELTVIRRLIEKRFGPIPEWAGARLNQSSPAELEDIGLRLLDVASLEELLK